MDVYTRLLRPIFFSLDPEEAHDAVLAMLESGSQWSLGPGMIRLMAGKAVPRSLRTVAGITLTNRRNGLCGIVSAVARAFLLYL